MNDIWKYILETAKMVVLALVIVLPIRYFIFQPFVVSGSSMNPSFEDGDYLLIDEISYRLREPKRGEVVVFRAPPHPSARYIKRIVGLPGEKIKVEEGRILIVKGKTSKVLKESYLPNGEKMDDQEMVLREDEYFVLGDNRTFSSDSRTWGPLAEQYIVGRAFFRALPLSRAQGIERPRYSFQHARCLAPCPEANAMSFSGPTLPLLQHVPFLFTLSLVPGSVQ